VVLPPDISRLVDDLSAAKGAVAVTLGGSRATGAADETSDWDLGLYYRGELDLAALARWGEVHPPGSWGRLMNGGAWLSVGGQKVDVLLRDLDAVESWSTRAAAGEFQIDGLLGYLAGVPTYLLLAERAIGRTLRGELPAVREFPSRLAEVAPGRWRFNRDFTLEHARMRATRGDVVGAVGQAAQAATEEAHARLSARREWVLNEKRIFERAEMRVLHEHFAHVPPTGDALLLLEWVERVASELRAS
jgi:hypothetical protein